MKNNKKKSPVKVIFTIVGALFGLLLLVMVIGALSGGLENSAGAGGDADPSDAIAEYGGCTAEITGGRFLSSYEGAPAVRVAFTYRNDGADPLYLLESFSIRAYQDGVELDYISLNDESEKARNTITGVKGGAGLQCEMVFATRSGAPVEVRVCTPTEAAERLAAATLINGGQ